MRQLGSDFEINNEFTVGSSASTVILVRARECKMLLSVIMSTCVLNQCQCAEDFDDSAPAPCAIQKEKSSCVLSMKSEFLAAALKGKINWLPSIAFCSVTPEDGGQQIWKIHPRVRLAAASKTERKILQFSDQGSGCLPLYLPEVYSCSFCCHRSCVATVEKCHFCGLCS